MVPACGSPLGLQLEKEAGSVKFEEERRLSKFQVSDKHIADSETSVIIKGISTTEEKLPSILDDQKDVLKTRPHSS